MSGKGCVPYLLHIARYLRFTQLPLLHRLEGVGVGRLVALCGRRLLHDGNEGAVAEELHVHLDGGSLVHGDQGTERVVAVEDVRDELFCVESVEDDSPGG